MKTYLRWVRIVAVCCCLCLVSCEDDDDPGETLTIESTIESIETVPVTADTQVLAGAAGMDLSNLQINTLFMLVESEKQDILKDVMLQQMQDMQNKGETLRETDLMRLQMLSAKWSSHVDLSLSMLAKVKDPTSAKAFIISLRSNVGPPASIKIDLKPEAKKVTIPAIKTLNGSIYHGPIKTDLKDGSQKTSPAKYPKKKKKVTPAPIPF
jgi:hypothetical protein